MAPDAGSAAIVLRAFAIALVALLLAGAWWAVRKWRPPRGDDKMTPVQHLEELRSRLLVAMAAWATAMLITFGSRVETTAGGIPYPVPAIQDNMAAQAFRAFADHLVPPDVTLVVTRPIDGFLAELYVAMGLAFVAALPIILWQVGGYFWPALREQERAALKRAFVPALLLFAAGVAFAWIYVLPFTLATLYGYGGALGADLLLIVSDLISFSIVMLLVLGLSFQTPLLMYAAARAGITDHRFFVRYWRHAVVLILIFSAFVTDPTIITQVIVAVPLIALYFVGVGAAKVGARGAP